jgi:hypothetical protein
MEYLSHNLVNFTNIIVDAPRILSKDESWALFLARTKGCRFALKQACIASGFANRYYPSRKGTDLLVTNRLDKASTARLRYWAQALVTRV